MATSKDSTCGYPTNLTGDALKTYWAANYKDGANLISLGKVTYFENMHILDYGAVPPASGRMQRPDISKTTFYILGNKDSDSATPFSYRAGAPLTGGTALMTLPKVIEIDSQGLTRVRPIITKASSAAAVSPTGMALAIEVALQPARGNATPVKPTDQNIGNHGVLQVDGLTGRVRIYRP